MFENVDIQHTHTYTHTHIRTTEAYLYYKLTNEPKGLGELKGLFSAFLFVTWYHKIKSECARIDQTRQLNDEHTYLTIV